MSFDHKQKEQVRSYLLGTMPGPEARVFEESYFKDQAFLLWVEAVEVGLIQDYLDGKLPPEKARSFESRYLHVTSLREKLEEVRHKKGQGVVVQRFGVLKWAPLGALALACLGGILYWVSRHSKVSPDTSVQIKQNNPPPAHVRLVPGVQLGGSSTMTEIQISTPPAPIEFDLEAPGRATPFQCSVAISEIEADGSLRRIWVSPSQLRSSPKGNIQQVVFQVDSSLFHHGDYRIDLEMPDGSDAGAYILRAISALPQTKGQAPRHE